MPSIPKCAESDPMPLNDAAIALVARRFAVLAEPMRLRLLQALFHGEKSVTALIHDTGGTQTNVSRHLQTLMHANVLTRRKDGPQVYYAIADPSIAPLCELVCGSLRQQLTTQAEAFPA
jgi:DNA-binding transcriptional ArsR family regulator